MKRLWLVLILLAGCARKDVHPTDRVGTYAVSVRNEPSPARTGENALLVRLEDGQGMTVLAILFGLLPILWGHGPGSDVMQRIAAPMVGGVVSSFVLELLVYPAVYAWWKGRRLPEGALS